MKHKVAQESSSFKRKKRKLFFSFYVARRYFFSKKSHNAVNVISAVSSVGIAIGTLALICVLSVFNGVELVINDMFSSFDPDIRITAVEGKTFRTDSLKFEALRNLPEVEVVTEVLEENALLSFKERLLPVSIKGVGEEFQEMTKINDIMFDGEFTLHDGVFNRIVPGIGVAGLLGLSAHFIDPIFIYAPKRTESMSLLRPEKSFIKLAAFVSGIFLVQQSQYDDNYALIGIKQARELFEYDDNTLTALELKLTDGIKKEATKKEIQTLLGDSYHVKNRYEQQETFYKITKAEKWMTFFILCFILLIASFNIIGPLSMLIIEKKSDINTLKSLGANNRLIKNIFLLEGWIISLFGALIGIFLGTLLCLLQQSFGFLKMGDGSFLESYPVVTKFSDIVLVFFTVLLLGFLASYYPIRYISKKKNSDLFK